MKKLKGLCIAATMFVTTWAHAGQFQHLIDGSVNLSNIKTDSDTTGESKDNLFELFVKYRNQIKPSLYLVSGFNFQDNATVTAFGLELGVEKDLNSSSDSVEIGPGIVMNFTDGEYGNQDYRSFGFMPYAFLRTFIGGSSAYVMWTLGYQFAFADRDGSDEDARGITMSFGFGLGF